MSHKHLSCDKTLSKDAEVIYMYVESHGVPIHTAYNKIT